MRQAWKSGPAKTWSCHQHWRDTFILKSRKTKCQQELHQDHTISTNTSYVLKKAFYQKLFITASTESGGGIFFFASLSCRPGSLTWAVWPCGRYIDPLGGAACCHFLPGAASATTGSCPQPPQIQQPANSSTQWFQIIPRWSRCRWNHTHIECNVSHWHLQKSGLFRPQTGPQVSR